MASITEWEQRIRAAGLEVHDSISVPGYARFEFRDPFGNRVEMIQPLTA